MQYRPYHWCAMFAMAAISSLAHAQVNGSNDLPDLGHGVRQPEDRPENAEKFALQFSGASHHFGVPKTRSGKRLKFDYNEENWGIGAQWEKPFRGPKGDWESWVTKSTVGIMKDSNYVIGGYAGYSLQKRIIDGHYINADVGGSLFLFYRALRYKESRYLIPAVMPVVSMEFKPLGIGMNLSGMPGFRTKDHDVDGMVYLQLTKSF